MLPSLDRGKKGPIGQQSAVTAEIQRSREMSLTCRVQYLNDVDPFAYASSYPEPPRPPVHTFSATLPLINQLAAVHRLLRAPHRVSSSFSFKKATAFLLIHSFIEGSRARANYIITCSRQWPTVAPPCGIILYRESIIHRIFNDIALIV